jgi:tetratricopeptide (TPR) repeat protein
MQERHRHIPDIHIQKGLSLRKVLRVQDALGVALERGDYATVIQSAHDLLQLDSQHLWAHWCLVRAYLSQGQVLRAMEACVRALEINPQSALLHQALGRTYLYSHDDSRTGVLSARDAFLTALRLPSGNRSCYQDLGQTYLVLAEFQRAERAFQRAIAFLRQEEDGYLLAWKSLALAGQGKSHEALSLSTQATLKTPTCSGTLRLAGVVHSVCGDFMQAERFLNVAKSQSCLDLDISAELSFVSKERLVKTKERRSGDMSCSSTSFSSPGITRLSKRVILGSNPWL